MIKGHTTIELTNVKTGEVERVEEDNMFTQAIPKIVNFCMTHPGLGIGINDFFSSEYWKTMLGGILLFDTAVDESLLYASANNKMIGCGSIDTSNSDPNVLVMGSYNSAESDTSQTLTKKFVYDFATSQANGTIASVCLTSLNAGFSGYGHEKDSGSITKHKFFSLAYALFEADGIEVDYNVSYEKVGEKYIPFCVDADNDLAYFFRVDTDSLKVASAKMTPAKFDLVRPMINTANITEYTEGNYTGNQYFHHFYNSDEQVLYFWIRRDSSIINQNETFDVYKLNMESRAVTKHCTFKNNGQTSMNNILFTDKYAYAVMSRKAVKIKLDDMSITQLNSDSDVGTPGTNKIYIMNGIITITSGAYSSPYRDVLINTYNDTVLYAEARIPLTYGTENGLLVPPLNNKQMIFATPKSRYKTSLSTNSLSNSNLSGSINTWTPNNYLATINNLGSPVTKTADKTMKITYTITAEE